jgi:hypothetical protein
MILRIRVCVANGAMGKPLSHPYPLVTSNRGVRPSDSRARKCSSEPFVFCRIRNYVGAGKLRIHRAACVAHPRALWMYW